jgi:hypothetical protein
MNLKQESPINLWRILYRKHFKLCLKHAVKYQLLDNYDVRHDAIGCVYYEVIENHNNLKELVEYAEYRFLQ